MTSRRTTLRAAYARARLLAECKREVIAAETPDPVERARRLCEASAHPHALVGSTLGAGVPVRWQPLFGRTVLRYYRAEMARLARLLDSPRIATTPGGFR